MIQYFKKLGAHTLIYGIGDMAVKAIAFLLIPLYTRHMTTDMYGVYNILQTMLMILVLILGLGFQSAIFKVYNESPDQKGKNDTIATALIFYLFWGTFVTGLLMMAAKSLTKVLFHDVTEAIYLRYVFGTVFFDLFRLMILSLLRAWEKPKLYIMINIFNFIVLMGLNIFNVALRNRGVLGVVESQFFSSIITFIILGILVFRKIPYHFSCKKLKALFSFGFPLVPSGIAAWSLSMTGQYFIHFYHTDHEVGLYGLGWRFGMIVNMILVRPFRTAWLPFMLSIKDEPRAKRIFSLTLTYFLAGGMILFLGLSLLGREIVILATKPEYFEGHRVIPFIAAAYLFYGLFNIVDAGVLITGKTKYYAIVTFFAAMVQCGLYFIIVPRFAIIGTAVITMISYLVLFIFMLIVSHQLYPIQYEKARIFKILVAGSIVLCFMGLKFHSIWLSILLKLLILLCYPVLLFILNFYSAQEKLIVLKWLKSKGLYSSGQDTLLK